MTKVTLLFALLLAAGLSATVAAADGTWAQSEFARAAQERLKTSRDHHQGRSFTSRRSDTRMPSYLRRAERAQSLKSQGDRR